MLYEVITEDHPSRHHRQQRINRQLVAHGWVKLERLPQEVEGRPTPQQQVTPLAFKNAPAHAQEASPGQDAKLV